MAIVGITAAMEVLFQSHPFLEVISSFLFLGRRALDGRRRAEEDGAGPLDSGGMRAENARKVLEAGADVLVVRSGIFGQDDIPGPVRGPLAELGSRGAPQI